MRLHLYAWLCVLLLLMLLGTIPAILARRTGRSFGRWWLYGVVLFPVAFPHARQLLAQAADERRRPDRALRPCPRCRTHVQADASHCHACETPLAQRKRAARTTLPPSRFKTRQEYERWKTARRR